MMGEQAGLGPGLQPMLAGIPPVTPVENFQNLHFIHFWGGVWYFI